MTVKELRRCTLTLANIMMERYDGRTPWGYDLGGGCAIGSAALLRYLAEEGEDALIVRGAFEGITHAFVVASVDDGVYVADPTFRQFRDGQKTKVVRCNGPFHKFNVVRIRDRKAALPEGYEVDTFTSSPRRISVLFNDWMDQSPTRRWKPLMEELRRRLS